MSWVKDVLGFELFNAKNIWKAIRKDPERLLLGAADPASTEIWNTILGKDYEPMVDQMGGAYDGKVLSIGDEGGVYKKAQNHGINTGPGRDMQRAAHVIAAMFAANGLMGMGGGGDTPAPNSGGMFDFQGMDWTDPSTYMNMPKPQMQQQQQPLPAPQPPRQIQPAPTSMDSLSWDSYLQNFYKFREMADMMTGNQQYYA